MRKPSSTLTPQELAIMKVVWRLRPRNVREVYEALRKTRAIAYTTVMTMMNVLEDKGYLEKKSDGRAHVYTPTKPRQQVVGAMVRDFVDRVFDGASGSLLLHLAKDSELAGASTQGGADDHPGDGGMISPAFAANLLSWSCPGRPPWLRSRRCCRSLFRLDAPACATPIGEAVDPVSRASLGSAVRTSAARDYRACTAANPPSPHRHRLRSCADGADRERLALDRRWSYCGRHPARLPVARMLA